MTSPRTEPAATDVLALPRPRWRLSPRGERWFDLLLVLAMLVPLAGYPVLGLFPASFLLGVAQVVPLCWRRRHPVPVFWAVAGASALQALLVEHPLWNQVAFPVVTYSIAKYARPAAGLLALGVGILGAGVASWVWLRGFEPEVALEAFLSYFMTISVIVTAAWALGSLSRVRRAYVEALVERGRRLEAEAAQRAELAAADERARIAREMHDVVAHGLSVIVVQADGARYAAAHDPDLAAGTLGTIAATGREALTEMRRMLGLLRGGADADTAGTRPQPRLADLAELVEEARVAGTSLTADLPEAWPDVPDGVALTAYRVVQEALTNVRKHAGPGASVALRVAVEREQLELELADDGRGAAAGNDGHGLGLLGMRERVAVHGGLLEAGPRPGGGFTMSARIPL